MLVDLNIDESLEQKSINFFQELKRELQLPSTSHVVKVTGIVLTELRKSFSLDESAAFLNSIPSLFQLLFVKQWTNSESSTSLMHLDELIEAVYQRDTTSRNPIFRTEIEVLNAVLVILRKLDKMIRVLDFPGFKFSLVQEVRQVPLEDAA